jgi:hypothetical protein
MEALNLIAQIHGAMSWPIYIDFTFDPVELESATCTGVSEKEDFFFLS